MVSKNIMYGLIIQVFLYTILLADDLKAQVKTIKEIQVQMESGNYDLKNVFLEIEKRTELKFVYPDRILESQTFIRITSKKQSVYDLLSNISQVAKLQFKQVNEVVYVGDAADKLPSDADISIIIQTLNITGRVTSQEDQEGLPGVNVIEKGTSNGTVTDVQGSYSLTVSVGATLVFSSVGYTSEEINIGNQSVIDLVMVLDIRQLEELVVVGYGTQKRGNITGSISSIKMEDSPGSLAPNINILSALRATTPGLNIGAVNTAGGDPSLLVRGQNSIRGSNYPLIVVDGVVFLGNLSDLNPADIASVDVLKDASSAAVYGSRAANGVIFFTTKRGKTEKPTLTFSSSAGVYVWNTKPEMMSLERNIQRTSHVVGASDPSEWMFPNEQYNYDRGISYNWMDLYSRTGKFNNNQLSVSGGVSKINYYMSAGYTDQKGVIVGDDYNRISLRGRINTDVTNWLEINLDGNFNRSDYSGIGANINNLFIGENNFTPYRGDPKDKLLEKWPRGEDRPGHNSDNPLWNTQKNVIDDVDYRNFYRLSTYAHVKVPFIEGLSYRLNYVVNNRQFNQERFFFEDYYVAGGPMWNIERYSPQVLQNRLSLANGYVTNRKISNYVVDNIINYNRQFNKHYFDATLVATRDFQADRSFTIRGNDFGANGNTLLGIDGITLASNKFIENAHIQFANIGYLARLSYTFNEKYHITSAYRRDGSSVFGREKKWGDFPSLGVAWTITEENFIGSGIRNYMSYLKLRASLGRNGNQGISPYETLARVSTGSQGGIRYQWSNQPGVSHYGLAITSLGNEFLGWETTTSFNAGFESILLKERIFMDLDFYFSKTTDQLFVREIPVMTGFTSIRASMGQVDNKGVELSLRTVNIQNNNLRWSSHLTFWQNRNVLAELYGDGKDDIANNLFIGKSLGAIYGFEWVGIVQENDTEYREKTGARPGDAKFNDLNGDGLITFADDRKVLGYNKENFRLNLSNTVNYRNFELYALFAGIFGGSKDNYYMQSNRSAYLSGDAQHLYHPLEKISYWTSENPSNKYPSPFYIDAMFLGLQSRTFVRLQEIVLSYNFRNDWMRNLKIDGLKVYTTIQNLYTFTGWDGEPEVGIPAISSSYPVPASFTIGLDVRF